MDIKKTVNEKYQQGLLLKENARKSLDNLDEYLEASKQFDEASELLINYLATPNLPLDDVIQSKVFSNYYLSESFSCLFSYYYENRQTDIAKEKQQKTIHHMTKALDLIKNEAQSCSSEMKEYLSTFLNKWEYFLKNEEIQLYAPDARKYWDENNAIEALDLYRKMSNMLKDLILFAQQIKIEPVYERIAMGNYIGMIANESSALAKIYLGKSSDNNPKQLKEDELLELIKHTFNAAQLAREAYNQNPEWEQYLIGARKTEDNIITLLKNNKDIWLSTYLFFEHNKEMLKFMKQIDLEKFKEVEAKIHFTENKAGKLWSFGSFWLLLFIPIIGIIIFLVSSNFSWWQLILIVIASETILLIIGGLSLRTTGDLTETNFIQLIKIALSYQLSHIKLFSSKSKIEDKTS